MRRASDDEGNFEYNRRTNRKILELFGKYSVDTIYVRVLKMVFNWAKTWWTFRSDHGSRPLFDYMNCRPAAEWEDSRRENAAWDYNNYTGWRHQHSGRRLQWEDCLNSALPEWRNVLEDNAHQWHAQRKKFLKTITAEYGLNTVGFKGFEADIRTPTISRRNKRRREEEKEEKWLVLPCAQWDYASSIGGDLYTTLIPDSQWEREKTFEFIADNETLVNIISGVAVPETEDKETISQIIETISEAMIRFNWGPRKSNGKPVKWRRRDLNKEADYIANFVMDTKADVNYWNKEFLANNLEKITSIQGWSDGGCRLEEGISSYGWILKGWTATSGPMILAAGGIFIARGARSSLEVEALGMKAAVQAFLMIIQETGVSEGKLLSFNFESKFKISSKRARKFDPIVQFVKGS
jgi:hypothetical protein